MLTPEDIPSFFADPNSLEEKDYLLVDYLFETNLAPPLACAQLCSEQSTAQWARPGVNEDLRPSFGAKAIRLDILESKNNLSKCRVRIAHKIENFGPRLPNLLSVLAGEGTFYAPGISSIRMEDLLFPSSFLTFFDGPQFGLAGLREKLKVFDRPFFVGVVKPNIGLSPKDFGEVAFEGFMGGLDLAKDDEMLFDTPASPYASRMRHAGQARLEAEKQTGLPKMMTANLTDENNAIPSLYEEAKKGGANAVMLNGLFTGLSSLRLLRKISEFPIMGHFTGMALYDRIPSHGIDSVILVKLQRLAGCDIIGIPGFNERMKNPDETVLKNIRACLEPLGQIKPALPVPGGANWAGSLLPVFEKIGHVDFGFIAGRGVFAHPSGPRAGAQSLVKTWHAIKNKHLSS